jgi:hypothetical protein
VAAKKPASKTSAKTNDTQGAGRSRKKWLIVAGLLLFLLLGWWLMSGDGGVQQLALAHEELRDAKDTMTEEEYRAKKDALKALAANMTREQRRELERIRDRFDDQRQDAQLARYFAMSPAERKEVINKEITREVAKARAKAQKAAQAPPKAKPAAPKPAAPPAQGPAAPQRVRTTPTAEQVDLSNRNSLVRGTPQARAGNDQKRLDMAAARLRAGLPTKIR